MSLKLVDNAKQAWRWFSVQAMGAAAIGVAAWQAVPLDLRDKVPEWLSTGTLAALLALGIAGRLVKQKDLP